MGKRQKQKDDSFICGLGEGQKMKIDDSAHGSKAFVPIQIDSGNSVEIVQIDGGLITGLPPNKPCADNLIYTVKDTRTNLNITWIIELKGTRNQGEAKHAIEQIVESIGYMQNEAAYPQAAKYIKKRDYVFAAVVGAPDRTLPVFNNEDIRTLCRKLQAISEKKKDIKNMFSLFCYIRPNRRCSEAKIRGEAPPYSIECYNNKDGFISYPSMLLRLLGN